MDKTETASPLPLRCLILAKESSDLEAALQSAGAEITRMTAGEAIRADLDPYDVFCSLGYDTLDARLRVRLEEETAKGKRFFAEAIGSWGGIYSAGPADTTRMRLVVLPAADGDGIEGLEAGDLLDDMSNRMRRPWYGVPGMRHLLVYREHIVAHRHWNASREEIENGSAPGLWTLGDTVMMTSFELRHFAKARFAPRATLRAW